MTVPMREDFLPIGTNRPGTHFAPGYPIGCVIHSTATPGASAADEDHYFHGANRGASAHIFVDNHEAIKVIPLSEEAWHAGQTANARYLSLEIAETADPDEFKQDIQDALDILEDMARVYSWPADTTHFPAHADTSAWFKETDHTDPVAYFASHGYSMSQLRADLAARLGQ